MSNTDNKEYETILYTQRGIMEICHWSNKPKANPYMDCVWNIVEKYRSKELIDNQSPNIEILNTLNNITTTLSSITNRLPKLEET